MDKVLIISPHMDDEVLACSSFLLDKTVELTILYMTCSHATVSSRIIQGEQIELRNKVGFDTIIDVDMDEWLNKLDRLSQNTLIDFFQFHINQVKPDILVIPNASYNQDHRAVHEAALTAVRPHDENHFVKRVMLFEEPESFGTLRHGQRFYPNYFRPIDIDKKLELIKIYKSQLRGHRSLDFIKSIASLRGEQICVPYAEAFDTLRWVD